MRSFLTSALALALAGCANVAQTPAPATPPATPRIVQVTPADMASLDPSDSILFWSQDRRSAAFRDMESLFPGLEVAPSATPRDLPAGRPLDPALAAKARSFMEATDTAGLMVLQDGKVLFEDYGLGMGADDRWTSFSVAKSFTSTLLGAAIRDGSIASIDTPVEDIIPALAETAYRGVTVGQIATMTSGVKWNENYADPDSDVAKMLAVVPVDGESQAVTYARTLTREAPAGEKFVYKTLETNLLGLLVEEATGRSLAAYAADKIVDPAGLESSLFWMQDLTGGNIGGCCLSLTLADYARVGQFVLEGGKGAVPDGWFAEATRPHVEFGGGFGYGYQWWTYPGDNYGAQGIFGQAITIIPEKRMVVAVISNWPQATSTENRNRFRALAGEIAAAR